jgi:nucleotide-binding universal stress UspA family protein
MVDIRRILCPLDFSDTSRHALDHAIAMANWYQSELTVQHVLYPRFLVKPPILFAEFVQNTVPTPYDRDAAFAQLREWLEPAARAGIKTNPVLDEGNPTSCILVRAADLQADLIVIGTHGLSGFDHLVLGSVAEKVLRKAACPVLTVPPAGVAAARAPYARLLCPVDFCESSLAALRTAFSLAEEADARLTILHVFDWPADDELLIEQFDAPEFRQKVEETARRRLEALVTEEERTWCTPATKVAYGKAHSQILEVASQEQADLIVMGVRGRNALDLTLFGSTTNQVVRRAACPVLTMKST